MLTKEEFLKLVQAFSVRPEQFISQENHYFDTNQFDLKESGCALRIRQKGSHLEMTLKQPATEGLLETNQSLTVEEAENMVRGGSLPDGHISELILEMNIDIQKLAYFGSLTTIRAEIEYLNGLLVLDHSFYLNKEDYEVEYEVSDYQTGFQHFTNLLTNLHIPIRKTKNKIRRFYLEKYNQMNLES
jgi:uncharacterized protein YjbK